MLKQIPTGLVLAGLLASATAAPLPVPAPTLYAGLPAETRQYVLAARATHAIAEPLQRCLNFPDFPGNQWKPGVAKWNCDPAHGKAMSLDTIIGMLDKGEVAELDKIMRRDLELHFSKTAFSELIHYHFRDFRGGDARADQVSQRWLKLAPDSPFAHYARGRYLAYLAWKARGEKYVQDTPKAQLREMRQFATESIEAMGRTLRLEPKMLPAHVVLLDMAGITGNDDLTAATFERARAIDPGCFTMASERMSKLRPKWGGSEAEMAAYAKELTGLVPVRPAVSLIVAGWREEAAEALSEDEQWNEAIALRLPAARMAPHWTVFSELGLNYANLSNGPSAPALAALLTAYRYTPEDYFVLRNLGNQLFLFQDYEWAYRVLAAADKGEAAAGPAEPRMRVQIQLGATLHFLERDEEAIAYLTPALKQAEARSYVLFYLVRSLIRSKQLVKAEQYALEHTREVPNDVQAWLNAADVYRHMEDRDKFAAALKRYLQLVDRSDKGQASTIAEVERVLKNLAAPARAN